MGNFENTLKGLGSPKNVFFDPSTITFCNPNLGSPRRLSIFFCFDKIVFEKKLLDFYSRFSSPMGGVTLPHKEFLFHDELYTTKRKKAECSVVLRLRGSCSIRKR